MEKNHALEQAHAQMESISEMVSALTVDYDRMEELRDTDRADLTDEDREELKELESMAGECNNEDDARERISEDPLSIELRTDWYTPGETPTASEFCILLCTGGPACRIVGDLDEHMQPSRPRLEYQDWGTPWTEMIDGVDHDALQTYCEQFYYGE